MSNDSDWVSEPELSKLVAVDLTSIMSMLNCLHRRRRTVETSTKS